MKFSQSLKHLKIIPLTTLLGLALSFTGFSQSCLPEGITFSTQTQIDSFQINYPNCTELEGDVIISGSDISNLIGLDNLTYIEGSLTIKGHSSLTSLMGLEGLSFIGDDLNFISTQALTNLIGLDNLAYIVNDLLIDGNWILDNLTGLEGLDSIGGNLDIYNNNYLTCLTGLENLNSIGGHISIGNNYRLYDITGLENIDANPISYLNIYANDALSNCDVQSICDFLAIPNSYSQFYANAAGCNSTAEVEAACLLGINDKTTSANHINIFPNPSSGKITLEIKEPQHQSQLSIFNLNGQELIKQQITEPAKEIDISHMTGGIYFVKFSNDREVKIFKVIKY